MHDSPAEIVSNLRAFSKRFNIDIINQVEPDGSLYHHGAYNFSYACYAFPVLAHQINLLSATPFAVSRQAFDKVKIAAMGMRWFCNLKEAPIFMHGRHPGRMSLNPSQYLSLAEAGRKYNDGKLERELAAAYLRFVPKDAGKPMFTGEGIIPESAPQGNLAMNFAALMGHRRGEWLAVVRGYGKYYWAQESYAGANRHGLFLGNGYLDILASGNPINIVDSGCDVAHGWDWRNLDGTTTFYAPLAKIANGNGTLGERSDICFMGGLSHDGRNGIFVFPLHSNFQYSKSLPDGMKNNPKKFFTAKKTYFFFENRIVCLGNEISLPDSQYPVRTTLFQKYLKESSIPIAVDGKTITELQFKTELAADKPHTLMDIQDTGYYIPAGQKVSLIREHQKSRDGHDEKDTEGDYATAWIEHGVNPDNAGYEYVVFPKTTPEAMESFAKEMAKQSSVVSRQSSADKNQDQRPYEILQKDSKAHVVWDLDSKTTGYVIFDPSWVPSNTDNRLLITDNLLLQVDKPCLVMIEEKAGGAVLMSVCDPDVHPGEKGLFIPSKVTITLRGKWKLDGKYPDAGMEDKGDGTSVFSLLCHEGKSYSYLINE
jgi:chondroitin-sulfate-ABC endolyase/exolyase